MEAPPRGEDEGKEARGGLEEHEELSDEDVFVYPPPEELKCVICYDWLREPVITRNCGHTFCRGCFERCVLSTRASCPTCRCPAHPSSSSLSGTELATSMVHPNRIVSGILEGLLVHCRYGLRKNAEGDWQPDPNGCREVIKRGNRPQHEKICPYARAQCVHAGLGCGWRGLRREVSDHLEVCHFEGLKDYIKKNRQEIAALKAQIRAQEVEIGFLKTKLDCLYEAVFPADEESSEPPSPDSLVTAESISEKFVSRKKNRQRNSEQARKLEKEKEKEREMMLERERKQRETAYLEQQRRKEYDALRELQTLSTDMVSCIRTLTAHEDTVEALTANGDHLFSASWDNSIKMWNCSTLENEHTFTCASDVRELLVHNNLLFSGCGTGTIQVWDMREYECVQTVRKHVEDVLTLQMADNSRLFSGSSDRTIRVWTVREDAGEGEDILTSIDTLRGHSNWVFALAYWNGLLFSGSSDHTIKVWEAESLRCVQTLTGHGDQVRALSVEDGYLYSGSYDSTMWDVRTLGCVHSLPVHNEVFGLATSAGYLFSGDENGTIKVWDLGTKRCTHTLSDHSGSVYAFATAKGRLFSASSDTTIKVWE